MQERRTAPRFVFSVQMEVRKNGDVFQGTSVNVSESGVLIETSKQLSPGQEVTIHLISPSEEEVVGVGTVVRHEDFGLGKYGIAVRWDLSQGQKRALLRMIKSNKT